MEIKLTVCAQDQLDEQKWGAQISEFLRGTVQVQVLNSEPHHVQESQILFFDINLQELGKKLEQVDRRRQAVLLVVQEESESSEALLSLVSDLLKGGKVDGAILVPFRKLEVLTCLRIYQQVTMWQEVSELNASLAKTVENLTEDLLLAERLQRGSLPERFPEVKNFRVASRYMAGTASGGDYFDLAESKDGKSLSIILSSSSSYGLSSAVLSVLMKVTLKLSKEDGGKSGPIQILKAIYDELLLILGDKDRLSIFYGTINRSDLRLRYVHLGKSIGYFARPNQAFTELASQGGAICKGTRILDVVENEVELTPDGRLVLVSGGFVEECGGTTQVSQILEKFRHKDPVTSLNELVFQVKANIPEEKGMPNRDCSAMIFDVESRTLRSVKQEPDES